MLAEKIKADFDKRQEKLPLKQRLLDDFKKFRYDYIEDIPTKMLSLDTPNYYFYKCRTNFFNNISIRIFRIHQAGINLSQEAERKCDEFLKYCDTIRVTTRKYTTEDINKANNILDILIKELS